MAIILLATDDTALAETIEAPLIAAGHEVHVCHDGAEAYELGTQIRPDLCLLDGALAIFNGLETATQLRNDPDVPGHAVIALITSTPPDPRQQEQAGVDACLGWTCDASAFIEWLERHLPPEAYMQEQRP